MNKHQRAAAARRAAGRIPLVGTAVVILPAAEAAVEAGLTSGSLGNPSSWMNFFRIVARNYTGVENGQINTTRLIATYVPIFVYLGARRFAGKHISRVFKPLHLRF